MECQEIRNEKGKKKKKSRSEVLNFERGKSMAWEIPEKAFEDSRID